jgi:hypothetical protein
MGKSSRSLSPGSLDSRVREELAARELAPRLASIADFLAAIERRRNLAQPSRIVAKFPVNCVNYLTLG